VNTIAKRFIRALGLVSLLCGMVAGALEGAIPAAAGPPACWGDAATIDDHTGQIMGTQGDDVIVGDAGVNTIDGKGGDDKICGLSTCW